MMTIELVTIGQSPATPRILRHCPGDRIIDCVDLSFICSLIYLLHKLINWDSSRALLFLFKLILIETVTDRWDEKATQPASLLHQSRLMIVFSFREELPMERHRHPDSSICARNLLHREGIQH